MAEREIGEPRAARRRFGTPPLPLGLRRDQTFRAAFTITDAADLREIAEGWGVSPGVALWAIVVNQLRRWRRIAPDYGPHGLAIAAGIRVLRQEANKRADASGGSSDDE